MSNQLESLILYKSPYTKRRIGSNNDGGYVIVELPGSYDMFLSGGISDDTNFEHALLNLYPSLVCHAYDGTIELINTPYSRFTFFKKNLGKTNNESLTNWSEYMESYTNIFMKMDIEGHEFKIVPTFEKNMSNIKQLVVEIHTPEDMGIYPDYFKGLEGTTNSDMFSMLKMINKTHTLVHFHANNGPSTHTIDGIVVPNVFELTYIRNEFISNKILNDEPLPTPLDAPNCSNRPIVVFKGFPYSTESLPHSNTYLQIVQPDSGFFSCCFIRLDRIISHFNEFKSLAIYVDCTQQFHRHKTFPEEDVSKTFFCETGDEIAYTREISISTCIDEPQFGNYRNINFKDLTPFITKYFTPSNAVLDLVTKYIEKYNIDITNTCGIRYRGGDKYIETNQPSYSTMLDKAREYKLLNPNTKFIVQSDEMSFINAFCNEFPGSVFFEETFLTPNTGYYLASIYLFSKFKSLITTSGNGELFISLYRGNANGLYQYLNRKAIMYGVPVVASEPCETPFWYQE